MIQDPDALITFLGKHGITLHQFMIPYLWYIDDLEDRGDHTVPPDKSDAPPERPSLLSKYMILLQEQGMEPIKASDINVLVKKGYIRNRNKDASRFHRHQIDVTDKFIDAFLTNQDNFQEFWDAYPTSVPNFDGKPGRVPLKSCDPFLLEKRYRSLVKTKKLHVQVLAALKWCIQVGRFPNMRIDNYLNSDMYKDMIDQMNDSSGLVKGARQGVR